MSGFAENQRPSTWVKFRPGLCSGCLAGCCQLPVEVTAQDLVRMGYLTADEAEGSLKKAARKLEKAQVVKSFRARTGLFTLCQTRDEDCIFLSPVGPSGRHCQIYERRPEVCRQFPAVGPRPGYCPQNPSAKPRTP